MGSSMQSRGRVWAQSMVLEEERIGRTQRTHCGRVEGWCWARHPGGPLVVSALGPPSVVVSPIVSRVGRPLQGASVYERQHDPSPDRNALNLTATTLNADPSHSHPTSSPGGHLVVVAQDTHLEG